MILVGFTETRKNMVDAFDPSESRNDDQGRAWHYRENLQGSEPNHYDGAIPIEDVLRRLFTWKPIEMPVVINDVPEMTSDGVDTYTITDDTSKHICRPRKALGPDDKGARLGTFKNGYKGHDYEEWLLNNVGTILDDELGIGSAGLLKQGAQAFVMVEVPETITTPEGVIFKPRLGAVTSFDGTIATTYKRQISNWVCRNTMMAGLRGESGQVYKVKHSSKSLGKIADVREALAIVHTISDDFAAEVAALCDVKVSEGDWEQFKEAIAPTKKEDGTSKSGRGLTMAEGKQDELDQLWYHDDRVKPWKDSAWGVVQAVNTHAHWFQTVRVAGGSEMNAEQKASARDERNMSLTVTGAFDTTDADTLATLNKILVAS
jgi:phage/plasmid-like protein (TIGR03299 family)